MKSFQRGGLFDGGFLKIGIACRYAKNGFLSHFLFQVRLRPVPNIHISGVSTADGVVQEQKTLRQHTQVSVGTNSYLVQKTVLSGVMECKEMCAALGQKYFSNRFLFLWSAH